MSYAVEFTPGAEEDLGRLYDFLLDRAETLEELDLAEEAIQVIRQAALSHLSTTPYSYRKVGARSTLRELIVPFGSTGYVLRFDIRSRELVLVIGARHQREEDFH
ncbi:MAG: type II toxin-antitoxin system RelE/ParE family toxin [Roseateles sp.]|jgi:plasmid stabilization system protein ParE|nr:type II toxin-antitoxin system RelE/ParE family toxin [Methylibium sp.]MBY0368947.1 type II toxin-antitoxin system RelE/ParE family toxin [Burkholderiaceae bacterium]|mmetsp:Transcript_31881/g.74771  ORF Transcript_31881/g.74771 Transcript_31881/m.74771 type:complete len:105 (-) Transcript_31881:327-641(-)